MVSAEMYGRIRKRHQKGAEAQYYGDGEWRVYERAKRGNWSAPTLSKKSCARFVDYLHGVAVEYQPLTALRKSHSLRKVTTHLIRPLSRNPYWRAAFFTFFFCA